MKPLLTPRPPPPPPASSTGLVPDVAMSALAPRLLSGLTRPASGLLRVPRAPLQARRPREVLSLVDKTIAMTACFLCILVPGGWVLAHLESYKKME
ncbi:cytochrome c oxidase subunit 8A, mitochondrial-like [Dromiciops gliroides]|uniref:cytochrome c oxidase subunit 8A, mitochondrial-like n=1 Tax=Dromiciops gliroides TaxID=33562 RepID=UPI001CC5DD6D|nr:cytochrome c oxidase subunit 8A, mitochondrial-like [Dromiciops gliroides]